MDASVHTHYRRGPRLVHETSRRLRFKLPLLGDPRLDYSWMQTWLEAIHGVDSVRINRPARSIVFAFDGSVRARAAILHCLNSAPQHPIPQGESEPPAAADASPLILKGALLLALPVLSVPVRKALTWLSISRVMIDGVDTLITQGIKVEVLDAIAVGLSAHKGDFFTANITDFLMSLGTYLEQKTQRQSDQMLRKLLRPEPVQAWVERDGQLCQVPEDQIHAGERVVVGVGEKIPIDGLVLDGMARVNQSSITGEPLPVRKEAMDRVIAGSVVEAGRLRIEARYVGDETTTARIARFIDESLEQGSDTERLADTLADRRVYLTLGTGALVYALTGEQRRLESVFMVDYSCALKLGTPLAFKSGMYRAAQSHALLKGGDAIEALAKVDTVVFDKTGTLTRSDLEVTDVIVLDPQRWPRERLLAVTASIEEHASHPIAEAIVRAARAENLNHIEHGEAEYLVAHGMRCPVDGDCLVIGSRHYLEEHEGLDFSPYRAQIDALYADGKTLLYVATTDEPIGLIGLRDSVREDARAVLDDLRRLGVSSLVMLTGDQRSRAEALGRELGIDDVYAEQVPEEKADVIQRLKAQGRHLAFVGDGVNDGPALATADVGIAMARGAELARATADVVLLEDRLSTLVEAMDIAQRTRRLVEQNYHAAIGINTGVMVGAALGWLSPVSTAVLHNGTTVALLLRALRGIATPSNTRQIPATTVNSVTQTHAIGG
ncbi:MAG TPA: heavy metal translocating P-type ATPase [Gammaproteobacteria bacterium]|nr:heavy metal translocating P-type ATPase [Gammaproteobacteria bacterium]